MLTAFLRGSGRCLGEHTKMIPRLRRIRRIFGKDISPMGIPLDPTVATDCSSFGTEKWHNATGAKRYLTAACAAFEPSRKKQKHTKNMGDILGHPANINSQVNICEHPCSQASLFVFFNDFGKGAVFKLDRSSSSSSIIPFIGVEFSLKTNTLY